ncbi:MAG: DUF72 domain-containing protein [Myxococcota bacterium]
MSGRVFVGTSGWNYDAWREGFYGDTPRRRWLAFCAERFTSVEVNGTFYRLQKPETFERWRDETPDDFRFAIKGHRYVTHNKKLKDPEEPVARSRDTARHLGHKLAAVVWQLPASFQRNPERLARFAETLGAWDDTRHAVELRDPSWFDGEVAACLGEHGVAVCWSDAPGWPMWEVVTTDMVYVRLHGHTRLYASAYSREHLSRWADRVHGWTSEGRDVHVYFDNDSEGAAPHDALTLLDMVRERRER